ncbi:MAG: hypothetical protein ACYSW0_26170 [Planctomycetota bacterium]|jgi:hypothetical protein
MRARNWLVINAGYFGLLGAAFVIAPSTVVALTYVPEASEIAPYVGRLAGSLGVALFAVIWAIRDTRDLAVLRTALAALLFVDLVNVALGVAGALSGVGGPAVFWWLGAAVILALAVGAAYFLLRTRSISAGS